MSKDEKKVIADMRENYGLGELRRSQLSPDPLAQFSLWFEQAREAGVVEPNAMTLASVSAAGEPSTRTVLLKGVEEAGFLFFTNYGSRKGRELEGTPAAALTFLWKEMERQVCVRGQVKRLSRAESESYFQSRPRESQLGAWASAQSEALESREVLEANFEEAEKRFAGGEIPVPDFWGGFALCPTAVEFWQGGAGRLHDRFEYGRADANCAWEIRRLSP